MEGSDKVMQEKLKNAPIVEAIIDIQHWFEEPVSSECLKLSIEDYDQAEPINRMGIEVRIQEGQLEQNILERGMLGYRYYSPDLGIAAHYRTNGLTISKLKPYDSWETFKPIAKIHWERYCTVTNASAATVSRIAVRYINRLMVPMGSNELIHIQSYLKNAPETPDEENRPWLEEFLCRMVMPLPEFEGKVIMHSSMDPVVKGTPPASTFSSGFGRVQATRCTTRDDSGSNLGYF